jgi:phosphoglycolate phosphatase-like HAD superfamily hydrolase
MKIRVYDKEGTLIYETNSYVDAFVFSCSHFDNDKNIAESKKVVGIVSEMYIKDENCGAPLGDFVDWVCKNLDNIIKEEKSTRTLLKEFYDQLAY